MLDARLDPTWLQEESSLLTIERADQLSMGPDWLQGERGCEGLRSETEKGKGEGVSGSSRSAPVHQQINKYPVGLMGKSSWLW